MSAAIAFVIVTAVALEAWLARRNLIWLASAGGDARSAELARGRTRLRLAATVLQAVAALVAMAVAPAALALAGAASALCAALAAGLILESAVDAWDALILRPRAGLGPRQPARLLRQQVRRVALGLVPAAPLAVLVGVATPFAGRWWWLAAWGAVCGAVLWREARPASIRAVRPLPPGEMQVRLSDMIRRMGLVGVTLAVAEESRHSTRLNARAEGILARRRIVLDDTLLAALEPDLIAAVAAHEAGHLAGHHRRKFLAWRLGVPLAVLAAAGVAGGDPGATLVGLVLAAPVMALWLRPVETWLIRRWEYDADSRAAAVAGAGAMAAALERLFAANAAVLSPEPLYAWFHSPHPPPGRRLARLQGGGD